MIEQIKHVGGEESEQAYRLRYNDAKVGIDLSILERQLSPTAIVGQRVLVSQRSWQRPS